MKCLSPPGARSPVGLATYQPSAVNATLLDRLSWLNQQFDDSFKGQVPMTAGTFFDAGQVTALLEKLKKKT